MKRLLAVSAILVAGVAQARAADMGSMSPSGPYFGLAGGVNFFGTGNATAINRTPSAIQFHFHPGMAI